MLSHIFEGDSQVPLNSGRRTSRSECRTAFLKTRQRSVTERAVLPEKGEVSAERAVLPEKMEVSAKKPFRGKKVVLFSLNSSNKK